MILSHKHRFVFIKGAKVAGTSVEIALSQICGADDIVTPILAADERYRLGTAGEPRNYAADRETERRYLDRVREASPEQLAAIEHPRTPFRAHMPLRDVIAFEPVAADYRLIFVERTPYAKVISCANWHEHRAEYEQGGTLGQTARNIADAVERIIDDGRIRNVRNIDRYRDCNGTIRASAWPFDRLEQSVSEFIAECGEDPVPLVRAKEGFGSTKLDFAAVLRTDQIALINDIFADEFEAFGFPMLSAAQPGRSASGTH